MSSLQQQLSAIAAASTHQLDLKAQKRAHGKSLLFEPQIAASQDFNTIYQICLEGFQELCMLDARFNAFAANIFSEQSKFEERGQMTRLENTKLDAVLESFLGLVSSRILLKPALKSVEWLLRRFRIHEDNTEYVLLTFLPYHHTPVFKTLLSILPREIPHSFRFLQPYVNSVANPPKTVIIYTASNTPNFFTLLSRYVLGLSKAHQHSTTLLNFWATVSTQSISNMLESARSGRANIQSQQQEKVFLLILPIISECLAMTAVPKLQLSCYTLLIIMASKGSMAEELLGGLMEAVARYWTSHSISGGLVCLAVLAQERQAMKLPKTVLRSILKLPDFPEHVALLTQQCQAGKLLYGLLLGMLDQADTFASPHNIATMQQIIRSNALNNQQAFLIIKALLSLAQNQDPVSSMESHSREQLRALVQDIVSTTSLQDIVQKVLALSEIHLNSIESNLQITIQSQQTLEQDYQSTEETMELESTQHVDIELMQSPFDSSPAPNFLHSRYANIFDHLLTTCLQISSLEQMRHFLSAPIFRRAEMMTAPTFFSFAVRIWCASYPYKTRKLVIAATVDAIRALESPADLQALLPYVLYALTDTNRSIRQSAAECLVAMERLSRANVEATNTLHLLGTWKSDDMSQGDEGRSQTIDIGEYHKILSKILVPSLEEFVLDSARLLRSLEAAMNGEATTTIKSKRKTTAKIKEALRTSLSKFLAIQAINTPILAVRVSLLSMLAGVGKVGSKSRSELLIPSVQRWIKAPLSQKEELGQSKQPTLACLLDTYLGAITARENSGVSLLVRLATASYGEFSDELIQAGFRRIKAIWPELKSASRISMSKALLDVALESKDDAQSKLRQREASNVLQSIKLSSDALKAFLDSLANNDQASNIEQPSKRRRTEAGPVDRFEDEVVANMKVDFQKVTVVLELIEGSGPQNHPMLFGGLFRLLGDLQLYKSQTGTDLVYLQTLIINSLQTIVNTLRGLSTLKIDRSDIRTDILVDCVRTTSSPQVQNAALLLTSSLAAWVPDLVLHGVMPIFTFMSTTILRQGDDYSAHVISETISQVIPPLVASLRKRNQDLVTGASEILYSFTSAFDHIPVQRRLGLFSHLCKTLGPQDSLYAVVAMLVERYPTDNKVRLFVVDLMQQFDVVIQLRTATLQLDLVQDILKPRRTISETVFDLKDKDDADAHEIMLHIFETLGSLLKNANLRFLLLRSLESDGSEYSLISGLLTALFQKSIHLSQNLPDRNGLREACGSVLDSLLSLLPTVEMAHLAEALLQAPDVSVHQHVLEALGRRLQELKQTDDRGRSAIIKILPQISELVKKSSDGELIQSALTCIDRIAERFGKKDTSAMIDASQTVLDVQNSGGINNRVLVSSLFCVASIIDATKDEFVPLVPKTLELAFDSLSTSMSSNSEHLHHAAYVVVWTVLETIPYALSGQNLNEVLRLSHQAARYFPLHGTVQSRLQFYQLATRNVDQRTWLMVLRRQWLHAAQAGYEALAEHIRVLGMALERYPKSVVVNAAELIFELLLEGLDLRRINKDDSCGVLLDDQHLAGVERMVIDTVLTFTMKLNDTIFRPLFSRLVEWAFTSLQKEDIEGRALRCTSLFSFTARMSEKLKGLATSYFTYALKPALEVLKGSFSRCDHDGILLQTTLEALKLGFEFDQDDFWQAPAHYNVMIEALIDQLAQSQSPLASNYIIPAVTSLCAATSSVDQHRAMNSAILKLTRADKASTRLHAVACQRHITERLGDEWLGLLPEMLPIISELQEDDDEEVERETQRWIKMIEDILGESLDEMLQ